MPRYEGDLPTAEETGEETPQQKVRDLRPDRYTFPLERFLEDDLLTLDRIQRGLIKATPTPLGALNRALDGGLWPEPYFLVSNPGLGKTQLALQLLLHAAQNDTPGVYIGLEIPRHQAVTRLLALLAGVEWSTVFRGRSKAQLQEVKFVAPQLAALPIHFAEVEWEQWSYEYIADTAKEMVAAYPNKRILLVLDFLQIVGGASPDQDIRSKVRAAAYAAARVCANLNAICFVISATARDKYALCDERVRKPKERLPEVGEGSPVWLQGIGKESGEIEFAAANQLAITYSEEKGWYIAIAKARAGRQTWVPTDFDGLRFSDRER